MSLRGIFRNVFVLVIAAGCVPGQTEACGLLHWWCWHRYQHLKAYYEGGGYGGYGSSGSYAYSGGAAPRTGNSPAANPQPAGPPPRGGGNVVQPTPPEPAAPDAPGGQGAQGDGGGIDGGPPSGQGRSPEAGGESTYFVGVTPLTVDDAAWTSRMNRLRSGIANVRIGEEIQQVRASVETIRTNVDALQSDTEQIRGDLALILEKLGIDKSRASDAADHAAPLIPQANPGDAP